MARYGLADHVFVCVNGEHLVLLDLKADRYWALEAAQTVGLDAVIEGWPVGCDEPADSRNNSLSAETTEAIATLRGRGLLVEGVPPGKKATPVSANVPQRDWVSEPDAARRPRAASWMRFLAAAMRAKILLRVLPFQRVIQRVKRRKERAGGGTSLDIARARELVQAFAHYRVFVFSSRNECLYDSLALLEFLAAYRIHPEWVFGVQTRPFEAHCWVQLGDIVCNDTVEHVSGYTPIMVV
jgi:hypothetical protein